MSYDPAWDMPQLNWQQQGSWEQGTIFPVVEPDAGTQVWLGPVAREWLPWICGALDQMRNPSAAIVANDTAMYNHLRRVDTLLGLLCGNGGSQCPVQLRLENCELQYSCDNGATYSNVPGWAEHFAECVKQAIIPTPPPLPPDAPIQQRACNIAAFLANDVIKVAVAQAINAYDNNLSLLAFAGNVAALTFAFDLPWTAAFIYGIYDLYAYFTAGNIANLRTAEADATFWSDVTCAIYSAIIADGVVTPANCATIISNICALSYMPTVAVQAVCAYVTQLGCDGLLQAQSAGVLNVADCSVCTGGWCFEWDFRTGTHGWVPDPTAACAPTWVSGVGWTGCYSAAFNVTECAIVYSAHGNGYGDITAMNFVKVWASFSGSETAPNSRQIMGVEHPTSVWTEHLSPGPFPVITGFPFGLGADLTINEVYCSLSDAGSDTMVLQRIQFSGHGSNPFTVNNCNP